EPNREHGLDSVDTLRAMHAGKVRAFFAVGGNFASATPDTARTEEAMRSLDLTVHVSTKLNRSHVVTGSEAMILLCRGRTKRSHQDSGDQVVTVEDSMVMVHASRGRLHPASTELLSEFELLTRRSE